MSDGCSSDLVGVVVQVAGATRAAGAARTVEALVVRERAEQKPCCSARHFYEVRPVQPPPRLGERSQDETVPRRDRLVVQPRLRALRPDLEQPHAGFLVELATQDEPLILDRLAPTPRPAP